LALAVLIAAGMIVNHFGFPIFFNAEFIFGGVFAMLVLQYFGIRHGVLAALGIASVLSFTWGHHYTLLILGVEALVVGWLNRRHRIGFIQADTLYWLGLGMPLVYLCYHYAMHVPQDHARFVMAKDMVNGVTNMVIARLVFTAFSLRSGSSPIPYREAVYNTLAFFVLAPTLTMLAVNGRAQFKETDTRIRATLIQNNGRLTDRLQTWVVNRKSAVFNLAKMAASTPPQRMQPFLEQAKKSDVNFLRIGLLDRTATTTAYYPLTDEQGQTNLGRSFSDRTYIPLLRQRLQPMLSEVLMGRIGTPRPIVAILAPVVTQGTYAGFVTAILSLEQIRDHLDKSVEGSAAFYTLLDRDGCVIMSNRTDQKIMGTLNRGQGHLFPIGEGLSQWIPTLPAHSPIFERWGRSFYVAEATIGDMAEWKLILEQPIAPFQKTLFDQFSKDLALLLLLLVLSLGVAEIVSRGMTRSLDERTQELLASEERFRTVADYTYAWERWDGPNGEIVYCSPSSERITGYSPEAFSTDPDLVERLVHPEDIPHWKTHYDKAHSSREALETTTPAAEEVDFRIVRKDGEIRWISHVCHPIHDEKGTYKGRRISNRDITDHKRLEEKLHQAQKLESLGILAGGVAHEMNNVLGAILGLASLHLELQPEGTPLYRAFKTITSACTRGRDVVRSLLGFARHSLVEEKPLDMNQLVQEEVRLLARTTQAQVHIQTDLAPGLRKIQGDPSALSQALMSLCLNALDAMPANGTLTLRTRNLGTDWIEVLVEDTGCGMPKEVLDKAMDPFFTTKGPDKGTGLGLSLTHTTVAAHHGHMEIQSEPGQGTRVSLRFPVYTAQAPEQLG
jgi:PAS domain S-box-containing protein